MDSHSFGEPIPVDTEEATGAEPSWTVDVIRIRGNVVVGTLLICPATLPPRRNKKNKILWKLPDSSINGDLPRFGEHEKKRLWELFKEQKKKRRKGPKYNGGEHEADEENEADEESNADEGIVDPQKGHDAGVPSSPLLLPPPGFASPPPGFGVSSSVETAATLLEHVAISPAPPPPGMRVSSSYPPHRYISVPTNNNTSPDAVASMLGASAMERFSHFIEDAALPVWLDGYTNEATQSLLVGGAHARATTPAARHAQWSSVLYDAAASNGQQRKLWTRRGWTAVPVAAADMRMVLLVANGTTLQQVDTEVLSYTLTLLFQEVEVTEDGNGHFAISNAILTLLPTPTTTTIP